MPSQRQNFSDTTPAAPAGAININWQAEAPSSVGNVRNLSAYINVGNILSGGYSNANVHSYLPTDSLIINIENEISSANNSIAGANAAIRALQANAYSNSNVASYLPIYSGNVNAAFYFGDGSHLTGITSGSNYSNTNVAAYLPFNSSNIRGGDAYFTGNVGIGISNVSSSANPFHLLTGVGGGGVGIFGLTDPNNSNYSFSETNYWLHNPSAPTQDQILWSLGAEGNYSNSGVLSNTDFYFYNDQTGFYDIYVNSNDNIGIGGNDAVLNPAIFANSSTGYVGIGTQIPAFKLDVSGNVNAVSYFGDGSHLTGIVSGSNYSNSNVAAYLPTDSTIINIKNTITNANNNIAGANAAIAVLQSEVYSNVNAAAFIPGIAMVTVDGGGVTPTLGNKGYLVIPYNGNIVSWNITADQVGNCQFNIQTANSVTFIGSVANICGGNYPTLSNAQGISSTNVVGWTTTITTGTVLHFTLLSAITINRTSLELIIQRS